jgi:Flp pilus assembly protein TadB
LILVLEDIERDVRVGDGLLTATSAALHRHPCTLAELRAALDAGAPLGAALGAVTAEDADERLVVQTLRVCERTGGRMGAAVDRAVLVLRERAAWQRERAVQAAQARLSATVLTLLPLAFAGWGVATSARIRRAYTDIPLCGVAAVAGLALNAIGWLWMRRLVHGDRR